jgi:hypothetical protein
LALSGQGGQSTARYLESAVDWPPALCATATPNPKLVYFRAAQWSGFTPPLTDGSSDIRDETEARSARRNIWSGRFDMPWDWRHARRGG